MNPEAIKQAKEELEKARQAVGILEQTGKISGAQVKSAWRDFLLAFYIVYQKLRAGAAKDADARQWYDLRENELTADPLLHYVHRARNAATHGLEISAETRVLFAA